MRFYGFYRAGAGHTKYLGIIDAETLEDAFEKMKDQYSEYWENSKRFTKCYVDNAEIPGKYRALGRR